MKQQTCHCKLSANCGVESESAADGTQMSSLESFIKTVSALSAKARHPKSGLVLSPPASLTSTYKVIQPFLVLHPCFVCYPCLVCQSNETKSCYRLTTCCFCPCRHFCHLYAGCRGSYSRLHLPARSALLTGGPGGRRVRSPFPSPQSSLPSYTCTCLAAPAHLAAKAPAAVVQVFHALELLDLVMHITRFSSPPCPQLSVCDSFRPQTAFAVPS